MSRAVAAAGAVTFAAAGLIVLVEQDCVDAAAGDGNATVTFGCYTGDAGIAMPILGAALLIAAAGCAAAAALMRRRHGPPLVASGLPLPGARNAGSDPPRRWIAPPTDMSVFTVPQKITATEAIAAVLQRVAAVEGHGTPGWSEAVLMLQRAARPPLSHDDAVAALENAAWSEAVVASLPDDAKWLVLRSAVRIAVADHELSVEEADTITQAIRDIWWYPEPAAREILERLIAETGTTTGTGTRSASTH